MNENTTPQNTKLTILGVGHTDATYCPKCWAEGSHDHWVRVVA